MAAILGFNEAFRHTFGTLLRQMAAHYHHDFGTTSGRRFCIWYDKFLAPMRA